MQMASEPAGKQAGGGAVAASQAGWAALMLHPDDDVAVALRDIAAGETVAVRGGGTQQDVRVREPIALGHKFAVRPIAAGASIRKYGERIGTATAGIDPAMHVHVHNLASARARRPA
jgi:hypothetical protein